MGFFIRRSSPSEEQDEQVLYYIDDNNFVRMSQSSRDRCGEIVAYIDENNFVRRSTAPYDTQGMIVNYIDEYGFVRQAATEDDIEGKVLYYIDDNGFVRVAKTPKDTGGQIVYYMQKEKKTAEKRKRGEEDKPLRILLITLVGLLLGTNLFTPVLIALGMSGNFLFGWIFKDMKAIPAYKRFRKDYSVFNIIWFAVEFVIIAIVAIFEADPTLLWGIFSAANALLFALSVIVGEKIYREHKAVVAAAIDGEEKTPSPDDIIESKTAVSAAYASPDAALSGISDNLEKVQKLKKMLERGLITKEEFEEKKVELLGPSDQKPLAKHGPMFWLWAFLGFAIFAYFVNVIIALNVGGSLFWMFDYILYGYFAGFIFMAIGIVGYFVSLTRIWKKKGTALTKIVSLILTVALLCATFAPLVFHDPFTYEANVHWTGIGGITYSVKNCEYRRTSVKIPSKYKGDPVTEIGYGAFSNHSKLEKLEIPDSITSISGNAFYFCGNLTTLVIPDSVTYIADDAFVGCYSLVIFCEAESKPEGWVSGWNCNYSYGSVQTNLSRYATVYWAGEWEYDWLGNPVPLS